MTDSSIEEATRVEAAKTLLGVRRYDPNIVPFVGALLTTDTSDSLRQQLVQALGAIPDTSGGGQLVDHFSELSTTLQLNAFAQIVKRSVWTSLLLDALESRQISLNQLGSANIHRLKTHSDRDLAKRTLILIADIRGPEEKEMEHLIATFSQVVEEPGNLENGRTLFATNCGTCHKFNGEGGDLAPDLTGMGAHGSRDLLTHILDPNRVVEPNFVSTSVETKDGEILDGIVVGENTSTVMMRNVTGTFEIQKQDIQNRRSSGLSLMPAGFEALGSDGLRDMIQYLCADDSQYRIIDLQTAFTANSQEGIYANRQSKKESLRFKQFGIVRVDGIPFEIMHPEKSQTGKNVIVLKGGRGYSKRHPRKVVAKTNIRAERIHVLGGVGGWAWPFGGDKYKGRDVVRFTLLFEDGLTEETVFRNGIEFADYNGRANVPGSREAAEIVRYGQVRWFSVNVKHDSIIKSVTLESFDNEVAPTFVALTAQTR
ncbi:MAG TPA: c-type cytochrome [Verrucomicrobiales bacterium]|nr:c-type cytochrome [Verrucomicrobiales bacterium]HIL68330.1 c-type cytochrome [Verrucomicrobiota bacterium]